MGNCPAFLRNSELRIKMEYAALNLAPGVPNRAEVNLLTSSFHRAAQLFLGGDWQPSCAHLPQKPSPQNWATNRSTHKAAMTATEQRNLYVFPLWREWLLLTMRPSQLSLYKQKTTLSSSSRISTKHGAAKYRDGAPQTRYAYFIVLEKPIPRRNSE